MADVSQYVRRNFGPRQSNAFQNGKDNNQVEKKTTIYFDAVAQCLYVLRLYRKRLLSQKKPVGRDAVVQTFTLLKLSQLNDISH